MSYNLPSKNDTSCETGILESQSYTTENLETFRSLDEFEIVEEIGTNASVGYFSIKFSKVLT